MAQSWGWSVLIKRRMKSGYILRVRLTGPINRLDMAHESEGEITDGLTVCCLGNRLGADPASGNEGEQHGVAGRI